MSTDAHIPIPLDISGKSRIFLALVHHPVLNRQGQVVTTAITNVDLHDLARSGRTYGVDTVFVVTPVTLQQRMVGQVLHHWTAGQGSSHTRRAEAIRHVTAVSSLQDAVQAIETQTGRAPLVAMTGAQMRAPNVDFQQIRQLLLKAPEENSRSLLLVFGTGWGMTQDLIDTADLRLPPILRDPLHAHRGGPYNHLSVRAAVAIALDRLLGEQK